MRMQYVLRQALGRSAFEPPEWETPDPLPNATAGAEPDATATQSELLEREGEYVQQYDARGHPENRQTKTAARRFRKAQNDVLTTIGVCVVVDSQGKISQKDSRQPEVDARRMAAIDQENRFGLGLALADDVVFHISSLFLENLRARLQTFSVYSRIPLLLVDRTEYRTLGSFAYLCAGGVAILTYMTLEIVWASVMEHTAGFLFDMVESSNLPRGRKEQAYWVIDVTERVLTWSGYVLLSPLELFGSLQGLGIIPAWPLLPGPTSRSIRALYGSLLPEPPAIWTARSSLDFAMVAATSPVILWALKDRFDVFMGSRLNKYFTIITPRPGSPDHTSIHAADGERWAQLHEVLSSQRPSVWSEVQMDFLPIVKALQFLRGLFVPKASPPLAPQPNGNPSTALSMQPLPSLISPSRTLVEEPASLESSLEFSLETNNPSSPTPPSESSRTSRRPSYSTASRPHTPTARPNNVQITTRHGSSDTLHMQVELSTTSPGAPIVTSAFSASPRPASATTTAHAAAATTTNITTPSGSSPAPRYHVTALSIFAADSLAKYLTYATVTLLRLPLDALFYRTIALTFLARRGDTGFRSDALRSSTAPIYSRHAWFGGTNEWRGMADYAAKMGICVGMELALGCSIWRVGTGVALWAGRRWYDWDRF